MRKKGFTLIELLAVIVVLAIIALIATPIVMSTIESTQKESAKLSMGNIKKTAELYYVNRLLSTNASGTQFKCDNGVCSNGIDTLQIKGVNPTSGTIFIDEKGNVTLDSIVINGYLCIEKDQSYSCSKTSGKVSNSSNTTLTLENAKESTLTNYKIYGNSVQTTYTGKNLMNTSNAILNGGTKTAIENGFKLVPTDKTGGNTLSNDYGRFIHNNNGNKDLHLEAGTYTISYNVKILEYSNGGDSATQFSHFIYLSDSATEVGSATLAQSADFNTGKITYKFTLDTPKWVTYVVRLNGITVEITNMQLESGSSATSFEPYVGGIAAPNPDYPQEISSVGDLVTDSSSANYGKYEISLKVTGESVSKSNMYNIYLDEPLRCVGNDCDYIDYKTGKLVRVIYDKQLTANLSWQDSWYPTLLIYLNESETAKNAKNTKVMSNYGTNPYVGIKHLAGSSLGFGSSDEYWGFENVSDLKTWLTDKNFMVYYPLLTPIETSIDLPNIKLFDGTNNISVETEIKPSNVEIEYYD